jgi:hypothetical protein
LPLFGIIFPVEGITFFLLAVAFWPIVVGVVITIGFFSAGFTVDVSVVEGFFVTVDYFFFASASFLALTTSESIFDYFLVYFLIYFFYSGIFSYP